ncbi:MAG: class I SAM-dependent methyltransferase [Candidatus Neomarinimicrobiota bacterium]
MQFKSQETARSYTQVAAQYAREYYREFEHKPLDRQLLDRFAEGITSSPPGPACDLGCGPGQVARYLKDRGVQDLFGLDISPGMLAQARLLNPDIDFREGNMLALDLEDGSLAAIAIFYAIVHFAPAQLPEVFKELARVLRPGGQLLVAFHLGTDALHIDELWDQQVDFEFYFFPRVIVEQALEQAGLSVQEVVERDPYDEVEYQSRRAYIFARK